MLITISSSDYLLNSVLTEMISHLNMGLTEVIRIYYDHSQSSGESLEESFKNAEQINILTINCCSICDCLEKIVMIRKLENYNEITPQLKSVLLETLNQVYMDLVKLEDPLLAFQVTKIIQLLALEKTN